MHELRQRVDVGAFQLLQRAPFEDFARQIVRQRELFEHFLRRRRRARLAGALQHRHVHLDEQHIAELFRRVDVEGLARHAVDALGALGQLAIEQRRLLRERRGVDAHAGHLDGDQHGHERQFQLVIDRIEVRRLSSSPDSRGPSCHVRSARSPA